MLPGAWEEMRADEVLRRRNICVRVTCTGILAGGGESLSVDTILGSIRLGVGGGLVHEVVGIVVDVRTT